MCVLVYVPANHKLPTRQELLAMHRQNPHGMGFASKSLNYKGMDFETFCNRLQFVPKDEDVIIHFRYATHGSVGVKNCHPFKKGKVWFAHNGILDITPRGDMTDSETAFRDILYPTIQEYGIDSEELQMTVDSIIGWSKFAIMGGDGKVRMFGDFTEYKGRYYSNTRHLYSMPRFTYSPRRFAV